MISHDGGPHLLQCYVTPTMLDDQPASADRHNGHITMRMQAGKHSLSRYPSPPLTDIPIPIHVTRDPEDHNGGPKAPLPPMTPQTAALSQEQTTPTMAVSHCSRGGYGVRGGGRGGPKDNREEGCRGVQERTTGGGSGGTAAHAMHVVVWAPGMYFSSFHFLLLTNDKYYFFRCVLHGIGQ